MPAGILVPTTDRFFELFLDGAPPETVALHVRANPDDFPGAEEQRAKLREADRPLSDMTEDYARQVKAWRAAGIVVQSLVVGPSRENPKYRDFWDNKLEAMAPIVAAGEDVRAVDFDALSDELAKMRRAGSQLANDHMEGIVTGSPQASFWTVVLPRGRHAQPETHGAREVTWIMNYRWITPYRLPQFMGGMAWYRYEQSDDVAKWRNYWVKVFKRSEPLDSKRQE